MDNFLIKVELSKERQVLYEKLSNIFGPETAIDYVCPKTEETRQQLSLEELRLRMYKYLYINKYLKKMKD